MYWNILIALALVGVHGRYLTEDDLSPVWISRVRRDARGAVTVNSDGTSGAVVKVPFARSGNNILSALGSADLDKNLKLSGATAGVMLNNVAKGHSLTLTDTHEPGFGDKLSAEGRLNLFQDNNHRLDAKAFATRNMPDIPHVPNFNTVGGGLDYMFKEKVGASLGASHTDFLNRNDYSVGGKMNLFRTPGSSIDFNAGYRKFDTPIMKSGWEPNFGFSFSKFF